MAKSKKRRSPGPKRDPGTSNYRKISSKANAVIAAARKSAYPANLKRLYGLDDGSLADAPERLSEDAADTYRTFLYACLSDMDDRRIPPTALQQAEKNRRDTMASAFSTTAPTVLAFALMDDGWTGGGSPAEIIDAVTPVEKLLPMKYYNQDTDSQLQRHQHLQYANGFTTALSDMIDWETILETGSLQDWSCELMKIIDSLAVEDRVQDLRRRRADIIKAAIDWTVAEIPSAEQDADETLRSLGIIPDMSRSHPSRAREAPKGSPLDPKADSLMAAMSGLSGMPRAPFLREQQPVPGPVRLDIPHDIGRHGGRIRFEQYEPEEPSLSKPWMRPIIAMSCLCEIQRSASLFRYLMRRGFRSDEVFYAAYSLIADQKADPTCLCSVMALMPMTTRFVHTGAIRLFQQSDETEDDVVYDVHARCPVPAEALELNDPSCSETGDLKSDGTSIWEAISIGAGILNGPRLRIRMRHRKTFMEMGLSERDADILCGYLEGVRTSKIHTLIGSLYLPDAPSRKPVPYAAPVQAAGPAPAQTEIAPDAMQADYERRLEAMKSQADRDLDKAAAELRRSRKAAGHELATAESRIRELEEALAEAEHKRKSSEAEARKLADTVLELTLEQSEDSVMDETDDGGGLPDWPCDIGKDCNIRFYGGHDNFLAEMSRRFPYVEFSPAWKMPNADGIAGADLILINTYGLKHKMWYSLKKAIDKSRQEYSLCPTKGANACSRAILDAYASWRADLDGTD